MNHRHTVSSSLLSFLLIMYKMNSTKVQNLGASLNNAHNMESSSGMRAQIFEKAHVLLKPEVYGIFVDKRQVAFRLLLAFTVEKLRRIPLQYRCGMLYVSKNNATTFVHHLTESPSRL